MRDLQTRIQLKALGLVELGDGVTFARDEGAHDAFRIRVTVPHDGPAKLRINGRESDATDVVDAVREFLKVVRT